MPFVNLFYCLINLAVFSYFFFENSSLGILWCALLNSIYIVYFAYANRRLVTVYVMLFTMFFIVPSIIFNDERYLFSGALFKNIHLSFDQVLTLCSSVYLSTIAFVFTLILTPYKEVALYRELKYDLKNKQIFLILLFSFFSITTSFNLYEFKVMLAEGYVAIVSGESSVQKSLAFVLIEYSFISLACCGVYLKHRTSMLLLLFYFMSIIIIGQRIPSFLAIITILLYFSRARFIDFRILHGFGFFIAIPLLQYLAAVRVYGSEALDYFDIAGSYIDLFRVTGFTQDTLKAAISYSGEFPVNIDPLDKVNQIIRVIQARVVDFGIDTPSTGFGANFSKQLSPELFFGGTTFASSSIAESYYYGGIGFIFLTSVVFIFLLIKSESFINNGSFYSVVYAVVVIPKLLGSVRNELFGWVFEVLVFSAIIIPFVFLTKELFLRKNSVVT